MEQAKEVQQTPASKSERWTSILDWMRFFLLLGATCFVLNTCVGFTKVLGMSMAPTLKDGSILVVNKIAARVGKPHIGDVVVLHKTGMRYDLIKRVVATEGDTIAIREGNIYVNSIPLLEVYALGKSNDMAETKVGKGCIFVAGDNREPGESLDSRDASIGQLPVSSVKGYAVFSAFPPYRIMKPLKL